MSLTVLRIVLHVLYNFIHTVFELHTNCHHLILIHIYITVMTSHKFYACAVATNITELFFSDEVWFLLSSYVNSQNNYYWAADNPQVYLETPLCLKK